MNRDEILEKIKNSKNDEGIIYAENQGRKCGIVLFGVVAIAIIGVAGFLVPREISRPITDTALILTATLGFTENLAKYRFLKQKKYAIYVALMAAMFLISVYRFSSTIVG